MKIFQIVVLIATMLSGILIAQTRFIDGESASIDPSTWSLSDNGWSFACKTKPTLGTAGMDLPFLESGAVGFCIDTGFPKDASNMQKLYYEVLPGSNASAPGIANPVFSKVSFKIKFDSRWEVFAAGGAPGGTGLYQSWQGSGWPPIQMRTDESTGVIRVYFLLSNDNCRGSFNTNSAKLYIGEFEKSAWYAIDVEFKFGYNGGGVLRVWKNGVSQIDLAGRVGYTPESAGGQAGTNDGGSVEFGMYQEACGKNKKVYFDDFYYYANYTPSTISGNQLVKSKPVKTGQSFTIRNSATRIIIFEVENNQTVQIFNVAGKIAAPTSYKPALLDNR